MLQFSSASLDGLWLDAQWPAGIHVLLGAPTDGLSQVCELAWGSARPSSGRVTLKDQVIYERPQLRAAIGSLSWEEPTVDRRGVRHHVESLLALHAPGGTSVDANDALARVGLTSLLESKSPGKHTARGVALAVALALDNPTALVLADPLGVEGIDVPAVCARLQQVAANAPVIVCTRRFADAVRLGADLYEFRGLRMVSGPVPARMLLRASSARFRAHVEDGASFMSALLQDPAVGSVQAPLDRNVLEVAGDDAEEVSRAILRASERSQVALISLSESDRTPVDPPARASTPGGGLA